MFNRRTQEREENISANKTSDYTGKKTWVVTGGETTRQNFFRDVREPKVALLGRRGGERQVKKKGRGADLHKDSAYIHIYIYIQGHT